jgi:hypothetical protein
MTPPSSVLFVTTYKTIRRVTAQTIQSTTFSLPLKFRISYKHLWFSTCYLCVAIEMCKEEGTFVLLRSSFWKALIARTSQIVKLLIV